MASFFLFTLFLSSLLWIINGSRKRAMQANFPNEPVKPSLWEVYSEKFADARSRPGPRFHSSSLKKFAPYALLVLMPLALTIFFTQDLLAIGLMAAGSLLMGGFVLYGFNLREHMNYEADMKNDLLVAESTSAIDEFTIPEEWSKLL